MYVFHFERVKNVLRNIQAFFLLAFNVSNFHVDFQIKL